jgi:hypothetical protein
LRTSRWIAAPLLGAFAAAAVAVQARIPVPRRIELGEPFVPRPEVAKLSAFGFHTALSDYYWLQAVQVVGASMRPEDEGTVLGRFIDVVTTVDPWVGHPYRFAAVWLTGREEDVRHANMLLRRSLDYHPDDWRNRFYLGFNHFYYLEEPDEAAVWFEQASRLPGSPTYLTGLAARLRAGQAGLDVAAGLIREMWRATDDPYERAEYEKMLDEIETERRARELDAARRRYQERFGSDVTRVEDLLRGSPPVLARLPEEPHGWEWVIDEETGEIRSSYYKNRYRPHYDPEERAAREGWRVRKAENGGATQEGSP